MLLQIKCPRTSKNVFLAKFIKDVFFGKFMVSDTSLRYNVGLDNFVHMKTGPVLAHVCISSTAPCVYVLCFS